MLTHRQGCKTETEFELSMPLEEILDTYAAKAPAGVQLLTMARAQEPGGG